MKYLPHSMSIWVLMPRTYKKSQTWWWVLTFSEERRKGSRKREVPLEINGQPVSTSGESSNQWKTPVQKTRWIAPEKKYSRLTADFWVHLYKQYVVEHMHTYLQFRKEWQASSRNSKKQWNLKGYTDWIPLIFIKKIQIREIKEVNVGCFL